MIRINSFVLPQLLHFNSVYRVVSFILTWGFILVFFGTDLSSSCLSLPVFLCRLFDLHCRSLI